MEKTVLITGASSGFGELMTKTLAKKGYHVAATMRDVEGKNANKAQALAEWATSENVHVHVIEMDVTKDDSVKSAIEQVINARGKIDVVVNNAGIGNFGASEGFSLAQMHTLFDVNVFGPMRVNKAVLTHMRREENGLIIQITSVLGRTIIPFMSLYSGTKFAMEAIAEGMHYELKETGVESVIIEPGGYPTTFGNNMVQAEQDLIQAYGDMAKNAQATMMKYMEVMSGPDAPNPQEIADGVLTLIETPKGKRPLRTAIGNEKAAAEAINQTSAQAQEQLLKGFGFM